MTIKTTVTHNDVEYTAEHAVITSTTLGYEGHGILTFYLYGWTPTSPRNSPCAGWSSA